MASNINRLRRLDPRKAAFFLCDVQEQFRKAIPLFEPMIKNTQKLLNAGKELEVPLIVTEQYPEKLGKTVKEFDISHACAVIEKTQFSMMVPDVDGRLKEIFNGKPQDVVLFGIEAHVCVEQTAMDLIAQNINVLLVADCSSSRLLQDRDMAIERLRHIGCVVTTTESVIFNLLQDKNHPKFNVLRKLVAEPSQHMHLGYSPATK